MLLLALFLLAAVADPIRLRSRTVDVAADSRRRGSPTAQLVGRGTYVVQFDAVDSSLLRALARVLGSEPTDYVPERALALHVGSARQAAALIEAVGPRVTHVERLERADRRGTWQAVRAAGPARVASLSAASRHAPGGPRRSPHAADVDRPVRVRARGVVSGTQASALVARAARMNASASIVDDTLVVDGVPAAHADAFVDELLGLDELRWVDVSEPYRALNRWSVTAIHRAADAVAATAQDSTGWQPLLGLRGAGQTLAIADTGVATGSCFFVDPRHRNVPRTSTQTVPPDNGHARVRAYWAVPGGDFGDEGDSEATGHGTHVAGTALGSGTGRSAPYSGVAPAARLVVEDLLDASTLTGSAGYLAVPDDIGATLLRFALDAGAPTFSGSFGSEADGQYTADAASVDRFCRDNPLFVAVFAAGNAGLPRSIVSPGTAKNALTVGATMNGAASLDLYERLTRPTSDYSAEWLADYSSRGDASLPFFKPDIVAPGGPYVTSADNDGPASCADDRVTTVGLAGTSMATPAAAGAVLLLREALANSTLLDAAGGGLARGSLLRALLVAGAQPLRGVYPGRTTLDSDAAGFGRVALDRSIGPAVSLAVLANEAAPHALTAAAPALVACVAIEGLAPTESLAGYELVVVLGYNDYPSSLFAAATLVNDVDLRVRPSGTATPLVGGPDGRRSTLERVVVRPARAVDIEVRLASLGFGGLQRVSVAALLRRVDGAGHSRRLVATPLAASDGRCQACGERFVPAAACAVCGNGVVEVGEQCEAGACCDVGTCRWRATGDCVLEVGACRVRGACVAGDGTCAVDPDAVYRGGAGSGCAPAAADAPSVCTRSAESWRAELRATGQLPAPLRATQSEELRICCAPFAAVAALRVSTEPLYAELVAEYIAARLNVAQADVTVPAQVLVAMHVAKTLIETHCTTIGFVESSVRTSAAALVELLRDEYNEAPDRVCPPADDPATALDPATVDEPWCALAPPAESALDELLCSGAPNRYNETTQRCACGPLVQPGEADCAHLACSGNGASVYDYAREAEHCVCLAGWTGDACDRCAVDPVDSATVRLCVGLGPLLAQQTGRTHAPLIVARSTLAGRLSGSFYGSIDGKAADVEPGSHGHDCQCRLASEVVAFARFASHRDALVAALAQQDAQARLAALFEAGAPRFVPARVAGSAGRVAPLLPLVLLLALQ